MEMLVGREWLGSAQPEPLCHSEQLPCLCQEMLLLSCTRTQEEEGHHKVPSPP